MKLFSIALDISCPCPVELAASLYELGHNINEGAFLSNFNWSVPIDNSTKEVDLKLERYNLETADINASKTLYISISYDNSSEHYVIATLIPFNGQLVVVVKSVIQSDFSQNGADIYEKIYAELEQNVSDTLMKLSHGLSEDSVILEHDFTKNSQVDLNALKIWHRSNQTTYKNDYAKNLYEAFEHTVKSSPDKHAIQFGDTSISYEDLHIKAENYASNMKSIMGEGDKQQVIAIYLPKSIELYASMLAVLKLQACYLPIDPEYPEDRVKNILNGSNPDLLIGTLGFHTSTLSVSVDTLETKTDVEINSKATDASGLNAVMIYTSGSTGMPKGVQLTHDNITHFCDWYISETDLSPTARCLQFTTVSFDASLLDIFPTFTAGATLVVPSNEQRHDFDQLDALIKKESVSHCFIPPAMLSALPQYNWPSMEFIITGGDVCDNASIEYWSKQTCLINIYGPTECTVLATFKRFSPESNNKVIGKPIHNTQIFLINEKGEPCQTLEQGELYISGKGVGAGYVQDKAQTTKQFMRLKSIEQAGMMYRTGDICFWDSNGEINFIGRQDDQLKIRGFRVELGEIENSILRLGIYSGCIVVVGDKKQIRAFVKTPKQGGSVNLLREKLADHLPNYMMPAIIMEVFEFPFTVNGKVDRKKLAELKLQTAVNDEDEKWTELQEELRLIWAEALDLEADDISLKSSFFDLGGHSLLVSKMLLVIKSTFEGNFTLARFMENPTIEALSNILTSNEQAKGAQISDRIYADMVLDHNIKPLSENNPYAFKPRAVLLTGATGFLGMHILEQLVQKENVTVYCHIRASSQDAAFKKLENNHQKFGIKNLNNNERIKVVCGDLAEPNLGLSSSDYTMLCENIDIIYHNGAQVNHIFDYTYLFNANVRSTADLIQMACTTHQKQLVFVSTLSAASNLNDDGCVLEEGPAGQLPAFVNNGYNLTKWVSEQLVWQAHERGLPVTLIRPGNITGHSKTGICFPDQNRILLLLKGSAQMGFAPDWDLQFDLCPVDFIAQGIVEGSMNEEQHTPVLHFHNPKPLTWKQYVSRLNHFGVSINFIPDKKWRKMLLTIDESNALYQVVSFYLDETSEDIGDISNIAFEKTLNRLKLFGMDYPNKDNTLIDANLGYLISSGFIEKTEMAETAFL